MKVSDVYAVYWRGNRSDHRGGGGGGADEAGSRPSGRGWGWGVGGFYVRRRVSGVGPSKQSGCFGSYPLAVEGAVSGTAARGFDGDPTPRAEAVRYYASVAGQGFGGDSPQAERWIDALVLSQTGRASRSEQRHGTAPLAQGPA